MVRAVGECRGRRARIPSAVRGGPVAMGCVVRRRPAPADGGRRRARLPRSRGRGLNAGSSRYTTAHSVAGAIAAAVVVLGTGDGGAGLSCACASLRRSAGVRRPSALNQCAISAMRACWASRRCNSSLRVLRCASRCRCVAAASWRAMTRKSPGDVLRQTATTAPWVPSVVLGMALRTIVARVPGR